MSLKRLILFGIAILVSVNGTVFGTLYVIEWLKGPTEDELKEQRLALERAALDKVYASLPPLEPFKSKANYLQTMGEAIGLCEAKLSEEVKEQKSWVINFNDNRYIAEQELYKIFLEYETVSKLDHPVQRFEITCEVSAEERAVTLWRADEI
jgi:hypothetical protein